MEVKKKVRDSKGRFIDKAISLKIKKDKSFKNVLIRIPTSVLTELDTWVQKKPWINRTQLIVEAIHEKLTNESV